MKNLNVVRALNIAVFCLGAAVNCAPKKQSSQGRSTSVAPAAGPAAPASTSTAPGGSPQTPAPQGSSSGGGGFVGENSTVILKMAAKGLAQFIRNSSPAIYQELPKDWSREKLAQVIETVRYEPLTERSREGDHLMFDYGTDAKGPFIVALKPFFHAYSSFPIKFADDIARGTLMTDVRLKLAHEVSHLMGLDEELAKVFSHRLMDSLYRDTILCSFRDGKGLKKRSKIKVPGTPTVIGAIQINRPSGLSNLTSFYYDATTNSLVKKLMYSISASPEDVFERKITPQGDLLTCFADRTHNGKNEFHLGKFLNQEACTSGSDYYTETFTTELVARGSVLTFTITTPSFYGHKAEVIHFANVDQLGEYKAEMSFIAKSSDTAQTIDLTCENRTTILKFPKAGDKLTPQNPKVFVYAAQEELAPIFHKLQPEIVATLEQFSKLKFKTVGALELSYVLFDDKQGQCAGKGEFFGHYQAYALQVVELEDGRKCTFGVRASFSWSRANELRLKGLRAIDPGDMLNDPRKLEAVVCVKDDKIVSNEEFKPMIMADLLPKSDPNACNYYPVQGK